MQRFAIFVAVLIVIVAIGSRPSHRASAKGSFCVCVPSRAKLILKSMVGRSTVTTVHAASIRRPDKSSTAQ
ncbi:hypothetical protein [Alloacidobacterium sp.]|uniref:hypothetical protein n=1 Tax=Alloacidobacterium sp. TaxID=2951999 RepID=UPI002D6B59F7|nr:hypothetical protein [Alloacidobacterium sp.]HYK37150.1 hypothetical protein [Alloacidobacterium sp.]